jgi:hypothetical protein
MSFSSNAVNLEWVRNNLVLRRGITQILIDAEKVQSLRTQSEEDSFNNYFMNTALVNREARRTFKSWEKKDPDLLNKLFKEMVS